MANKSANKRNRITKVKKQRNKNGQPEFARELLVPLEDKELIKKGDQLVNAEMSLTALQDEKNAAVAGWNKGIKEVRTEIKTLVSELDSKKQLRTVKCFDNPDYKQNKIDTVRTDTGDVVETRAMTAEDRQQDFAT